MKTVRNIIMAMFFGAAVILICAAPAVGAVQIRLRDSVQLKTGAVRLADIAELAVDNPELTDRLHDLVVLNLDETCRNTNIGSFEVSRALAQANIEPASVDIYGASYCRLSLLGGSSASESPEGNTLPRLLVAEDNKAQAGLNTVADKLTATVARLTRLSASKLTIDWHCNDKDFLQKPACDDRYEIIPRSTVDLGRVYFDVVDTQAATGDQTGAAVVDGQITRVYGNVQYLCESLAAARTLQPGQVIGSDDIKMLPRRITSFRDAGILDEKMVVGQEVLRTIPANTLILSSMVKKLQLVKRKDFITVFYKNCRVQVRLRGQALEDGAYGDTISVRNPMNKSIIRARVSGPGEATVEGEEGTDPGAEVALALPVAPDNDNLSGKNR